MEYKEGHWLVHEECIAHAAVCQQVPEATSKSEKTKPITLAVIEFLLKASVSYTVTQSVS